VIRNDAEYRESKARLEDFKDQVARIRRELGSRGLGHEHIVLAVAPQETMLEQLTWDVDLYDRLKAGDLGSVPYFPPEERGKALICLRIVKGWTQRQLADALGVAEAQVSRDERNEYHGISLDRYSRTLEVLGFCDEGHFLRREVVRVINVPAILRTAASFTPPSSAAVAPREAK